jgi:glycosyltransferase involved in cell wall biosynthesis
MMKILFALSQLPYPPRNGVTIPTWNYMQGLSRSHEVSLLLLRDPLWESADEDVERNRAFVENLWVTDVKKLPASRRIRDELRGNRLFHIGRSYDKTVIGGIFARHQFDAVWISADEILDVIDVLREYSSPGVTYVAGLNDCITDVFLYAKSRVFIKGGSAKEKIFKLIKWLRGMRAGPIETRLLRDYDIIQVQSHEDQRSLSRVSAGELDSKVVVLSNGVAPELLKIDTSVDNKNVLFVGSLRGYSGIVEMLLDEVWPKIKERHPGAVFHIVGKGASDMLRRKIAKSEDIIHSEFVADIRDVYKDKALSFSPVFKDYGLINKVIESMAAGVPVVADRGSFNCIPEFEASKHGMVANNAGAMVKAANHLLSSRELRVRMGRESRKLVLKHFNWEDRIRSIQSRLEPAKDSRVGARIQ